MYHKHLIQTEGLLVSGRNGNGEAVQLRYYLLQSEEDGRRGILVEQFDANGLLKEACGYAPLEGNQEEVTAFVRLAARNTVLPFGLCDVIQDHFGTVPPRVETES